MGGKGSASAPPPVSAPSSGNDEAMMMMMMSMMEGMATPSMPDAIATPEIESAEPVNWESQMNALKDQALADYDANAADRKGRLSTLHSSLTDSGQDTEMSNSLLGNGQ